MTRIKSHTARELSPEPALGRSKRSPVKRAGSMSQKSACDSQEAGRTMPCDKKVRTRHAFFDAPSPLASGREMFMLTSPAGNAWWKTGAWANGANAAELPGHLSDIHLTSDPLFRHHPGGSYNSATFTRIATAAHNGQPAEVFALLSHITSGFTTLEHAAFGTTLSELDSPTIEQIDIYNTSRLALQRAHLHAVVHALVGGGAAIDKIRTMESIAWSHPSVLQNMRMADLNLMHIASMTPMTADDRALIISYFKTKNIDTMAATPQGLTPLHLLAAQPDAVTSLGLLAPFGGFSTRDINACDNFGRSPLFIATLVQPDNLGAFVWFVQNGADTSFLTGNSPHSLTTRPVQRLPIDRVDETCPPLVPV